MSVSDTDREEAREKFFTGGAWEAMTDDTRARAEAAADAWSRWSDAKDGQRIRRMFIAGWMQRDRDRPVVPDAAARTIREFHGDDVWRDDEGIVWVRQSQLPVVPVPTRKQIGLAVEDAWDVGPLPGVSMAGRIADAVLALFSPVEGNTK